MQEAVEHGDGGGVLGQDRAPLIERPVAGNAQAASLVGGGDEAEQQLKLLDELEQPMPPKLFVSRVSTGAWLAITSPVYWVRDDLPGTMQLGNRLPRRESNPPKLPQNDRRSTHMEVCKEGTLPTAKCRRASIRLDRSWA